MLKGSKLKRVLFYIFVSRFLIFSIALVRWLSFAGKKNFLDIFYHWDANWYESIVKGGYQFTNVYQQSNVAFLPFYPFSGKLLSLLISNERLALLLFANGAFFIFIFLLYQLAKVEFDEKVAGKTILFISFFPLSMVFSLPYSESVFLTLIVCCLLLFKNRKFFLACVTGSLAILTRIQGIALLPTLLLSMKSQKLVQLKNHLFFSLLPLGLVMYCLYLFYQFHDFLLLFHIRSAWDSHVVTPMMFFWQFGQFLISTPPTHYLFGLGIFDLGVFIFVIFLLFYGMRLLPMYLFIYCFTIIVMAFSFILGARQIYPVLSVNRYVLAAFPLFIVLAKLMTRPVYIAMYFLLSIAFLLTFSWNYFSGKLVF